MNKIIDKNTFFSSSELKTHTKDILDKADEHGEVFIMTNNKPRAILVSVSQYNELLSRKKGFRVIGDIIPISQEDKVEITKNSSEMRKGEYISEEEFFSDLIK